VTRFHQSFRDARDTILIVESGEKKVSSTAGHALMESNPYAQIRFSQAGENLLVLKGALEAGDWDHFVALMEEEALSLHAMMLTGRPGYLLMQPGTLSIIHKVREFRKETGSRIGFTLDAGANVHLIYPNAEADTMDAFISSELISHCENGMLIRDRIGTGPEII
jgi:diphosphomevalonate decarboxylase